MQKIFPHRREIVRKSPVSLANFFKITVSTRICRVDKSYRPYLRYQCTNNWYAFMTRCLLLLTIQAIVLHASLGCGMGYALAADEELTGVCCTCCPCAGCDCTGDSGTHDTPEQGCEHVCCTFIAVERATTDVPTLDFSLVMGWLTPDLTSPEIESCVNSRRSFTALPFVRTGMPLRADMQVWRI